MICTVCGLELEDDDAELASQIYDPGDEVCDECRVSLAEAREDGGFGFSDEELC